MQTLILESFLLTSILLVVRAQVIVRNGCSYGWDAPAYKLNTKKEFCYKFYVDMGNPVNWFQAVRRCREEGAELFYPEGQDESYWVWRIISEPQIDKKPPHHNDKLADAWYMNAHKYLYKENETAWADGRPVEDSVGVMFNGILNSPPIVCQKELETPACFILTRYAIFEDVQCGTPKKKVGYVCKKEKDLIVNKLVPNIDQCLNDLTVNIACPAGWLEPQNQVTVVPSCYKFVTASVSWDTAYLACKKMEADLLYFDSSEEVFWVFNASKQLPRYRYLLLIHINKQGIWEIIFLTSVRRR